MAVKFIPALAAGLVAILSPTLSFGQAIPRVTQPVDESALVTLKGNTHPMARPEFDRGPADDSVSGRMLLLLKRSPEQDAALQQLLQDQQNVGSPSFHKWLTPEQFGQQFGIADADIQTVTAYLQTNGFTVGRIYKNKSAIEVTGTVAQLRNTFHTQIHTYSINGQEFFANANNPQIPAALAPVVSGFAALNNIKMTAPEEITAKSIPVDVDEQRHRLNPQYTGTNSNGTYYLLAPADIQTIYNIPVTSGNSLGSGGAGVTVGVISDSQINLTLLSRYRTLTSLPSNTPIEIVDGDNPVITPTATGPDATISYEQMELIGAAAPYANLNYYTAATTDYDSGLNFSIIRAVEDNAVSVLAIGFQSCESNLGALGNLLANSAWMQASAQGITVVAATGDSGSAACDTPGSSTTTGGLAVNGYASTPYDTAVGGTDFYYNGNISNASTYWNQTAPTAAPYGSAKSYIPEVAWNDSDQNDDEVSGTSLVYGGGSGFSTLGLVNTTTLAQSAYPVPSWQTSAQTSNGYTPTTGARSIPDVSFFAGNGYNASWYAICASPVDCQPSITTATITGGTAGAAAVFAGIMADVVEKYGNQGNINPTLYSMSSTSGNFHLSTFGSDTTMACTSGTGCTGGDLYYSGLEAYPVGSANYNEATGLGSVNATTFITNWKNPATKTTSTALAITNNATHAAVTTVVHGTPLNLTATITASGTATGNVAFETNSPLPDYTGIIAEPLSGNVATSGYNYFLPGGTYNVSARYGGDANYLPSVGTAPITVTPEATRMLTDYTLYASGSSVVYGTTVDVTVEPFSAASNNNVSIPTGTVGMYANGSNDAYVVIPMSSEGTATFNSNLLAGSQTYTLRFGYSGDPSYQPLAPTAAYTITVTQATSSTTLSESGTDYTKATNQTVTVTAIVTSPASLLTGVPPTGTVSFNTAGGNTTATLIGGFNASGQAVGIASIQVKASQIPSGGSLTGTYSSDVNYGASSGSVTIATNATNYANNGGLTLSTNSNTVATDGTLTITATATEGGTTNPTGTVQFYANGVSLGTITLANNAGGKGIFTVPLTSGYLPFPSGTATITAVYIPSLVSYAPVTASTTVNVTDDHTIADFSLSTDKLVQTIDSSDNDAYFKVQVTAVANFADSNPIALTCTVPGSSNLGCTLGNTSVTLGSSGTAVVSLEVYGEPTGGTGALHPPVQPEHWWLVGGGSALACVFLLGIPARRKGLQGWLVVLMCATLIGGSITGCGSNNIATNSLESGNQLKHSGSHADYTSGLQTNSVAPGTYTVIITGTASANTTIVHNTSVKIIVSTGQQLANGNYTLTNFNSQNLITDPSASTTSGTGLVQNSADGTSDQYWTFTYQNNGYYTIQNQANGLYLTDPSGNTGIIQVTQQTATGDGTQLWTLNSTEGGYEVVNAQSGGVLDDDTFYTNQGAEVICYPQKAIPDGINQTWYIQPAP